MRFPENLEQVLITDFSGIVDDLHRLGMAGQPRAHFFVSWVGSEPADAAHRRHPHARNGPERFFRPPVAAEREIGDFAAFRVGAF